jgi:hypothetical protein
MIIKERIMLHSEIYNDLKDEIVVVPGTNDFGDKGWFVAVKTNDPIRNNPINPVMWYKDQMDAIENIEFVAKLKKFI